MTDSSQVRSSLARKVDESLPRLIETTRQLVAVASPNPPSDTAEIAGTVQGLLSAIPDIAIERIAPEPRIVSIVARIRAARPGRRADRLCSFNEHAASRGLVPSGRRTGLRRRA